MSIILPITFPFIGNAFFDMKGLLFGMMFQFVVGYGASVFRYKK